MDDCDGCVCISCYRFSEVAKSSMQPMRVPEGSQRWVSMSTTAAADAVSLNKALNAGQIATSESESGSVCQCEGMYNAEQ